MFKTLKEAFKMKDLRSKILITLLLLLVYRIGCWLPVPGIDPIVFSTNVENNTFLNLLSSLAGGALQNGAILAIGVGPYITSSIVMQLLTIAIPSLERLSKQGDDGRKKIAVYTRYAALVLALAQATAIVLSFNNSDAIKYDLFGANIHAFVPCLVVILTLTAGSMFTVWIGERITEKGVSNGMSMLIFVGILSTGVSALYGAFTTVVSDGIENIIEPLVFLVLLVAIFMMIIFVDLGERKIPVAYAKQMRGRKMYGGQNTHIPIKVHANGVLPIIFAFALISFPQLIISIFWQGTSADIWFAQNLGTGTWLNMIVLSLLILAFAYFYSSIQFNPEDISRRLQQNGGFVLGYRPGKPTADFLKRVNKRITFFGALFLMLVALLPSLVFMIAIPGANLLNAFSAIGLLIIVSVALEFEKNLESQMLMKTYKGFLK
ncbi:MAG: preprotein translocase subunit SecY [Firmicutes bacterium]|nr:preprotein translocase subunit SecY [Bacillota bacterium]